MHDSYVIISDDGFYSFGKWVKEYPDAQTWEDYTSAEKAFTKLESDLRWIDTPDIMLIGSYGYEHEEVILMSEPVDK